MIGLASFLRRDPRRRSQDRRRCTNPALSGGRGAAVAVIAQDATREEAHQPQHAEALPLFSSPFASARSTGRRLRRTVGLWFIVAGGLVALSSTAFQAYVSYVEWQLSHVVNLPAPPPVVVEIVVPAGFDAVAPEEPALQPAAVVATEASATVLAPKPLLPPIRLSIPSIDLDAKVVEVGTRVEKGKVVWEVPAHAVGRYRTTALPGEGNNIVMAGHISSPFRGEGSIFGRLPNVRPRDIVFVETEGAVFPYRVISRDIVPPDAVYLMEPTPTEVLTMVTCYPDLVYSHRLVVRAVPIDLSSEDAEPLYALGAKP